MTQWTDNDKNFDSIEQANLAWLRADLEAYLRFHEANGGHLPENFQYSPPIAADFDKDSRVKAVRRIAYLSYSIFVNLALAQKAAEEIPDQFPGIIDAYDYISRVYLRLGAAIDIAKLLDSEQRGTFRKTWGVTKTKAAPNYDKLKKHLDDQDTYNNYLKHTGMPPLRVESELGDEVVLVASKLDRRALGGQNISPWKASDADTTIKQQAKTAIKNALSAFNNYFAALAEKTPERLKDWQMTLKTEPQGIGALQPVDGYVVTSLQMPRSGTV